jgi:hypothetical protein
MNTDIEISKELLEPKSGVIYQSDLQLREIAINSKLS